MLQNQSMMLKSNLKSISNAEDLMRSIDVVASYFGKFYVWQSSTYRFYGFTHKDNYYVVWSVKLREHKPKIKLAKKQGLAFYLDREKDIFDDF